MNAPSSERGSLMGANIVVLVGAMLGLAVGAHTFGFSFGIFLEAFEREFGWSRGETSLAMTISSGVLFLGSSFAGKVADTVGPCVGSSLSMLIMGLGLLMLPYVMNNMLALWLAYFTLTVIGLGTTPAVLLRPVVAAFSKNRGLAVGIALCGTGLGAALAPQLVNGFVEAGGWQAGFTGMGGLAILCVPILWFTLPNSTSTSTTSSESAAPTIAEGLTLREASRTQVFWTLSAVGVLTSFGVSSVVSHLIPFVRDLGGSGAKAAELASVLGLAAVVGRVLTGALLDRFHGSLVGIALICGGLFGAVLLRFFGIEFGLISVVLVGLALGAEVDLMAYLVSRYFGVRYHGAIFGWTYGMVALGSMIAPPFMGVLYDTHGDYDSGLAFALGSLSAAALLCLLLGRYRFSAQH